MRFAPKTEQEIREMGLLPDGDYSFEVVVAKERMSKNGAEMIELQLRIYDAKDSAHLIYDYLLEAMAFKLIHFAEATGNEQKYLAGVLTASDCEGKKGIATIITQKSKDPAYFDKNVVKDYFSPKSGTDRQTKPDTKQEEAFTDDIPF